MHNFTSGDWRVRTLNSEDADPGNHSTLSSNQFTFASGRYKCDISAPAFKVQHHQVRLTNVTDTTYYYGSIEHSEDTDWTSNRSVLSVYLDNATSKTFQVEHRSDTSYSTNGMGIGHTWAESMFTLWETLRGKPL